MSISKNILSYIPQRAPFVMIDTLEHCNNNSATTTFEVKANHLFIQNGKLEEPALIENIAQTAAARMGFICEQEQKPVPPGFIGAVQQLKITALPKVGDVLYTSISIKNQVFNATIIEGVITVNNICIASCEMKIFVS